MATWPAAPGAQPTPMMLLASEFGVGASQTTSGEFCEKLCEAPSRKMAASEAMIQSDLFFMVPSYKEFAS
jgi:hypothetical protein